MHQTESRCTRRTGTRLHHSLSSYFLHEYSTYCSYSAVVWQSNCPWHCAGGRLVPIQCNQVYSTFHMIPEFWWRTKHSKFCNTGSNILWTRKHKPLNFPKVARWPRAGGQGRAWSPPQPGRGSSTRRRREPVRAGWETSPETAGWETSRTEPVGTAIRSEEDVGDIANRDSDSHQGRLPAQTGIGYLVSQGRRPAAAAGSLFTGSGSFPISASTASQMPWRV